MPAKSLLFPFCLSTGLFCPRPSGAAAEDPSSPALASAVLGVAPALVESLSGSLGIPPAQGRLPWGFAANKTEPPPPQDLTEINKQRNALVQIVIQAGKEKHWELASVSLAAVCDRAVSPCGGDTEDIRGIKARTVRAFFPCL